MEKVFIISACRTPIGKMGGLLASVSAVDLGALVIKEAVKRARINKEDVEHCIMGCVLQAGQGQNVARQSALQAGLSVSSTAETLNVVCGSGLDAVNSAARMIRAGDADLVIAGGMESMSKAPFVLQDGRFGYRMGYPVKNSPLVDAMVNDALWDAFNDCHMGVTAENIAKEYNLNRTEADAFAVKSQEKAIFAQNHRFFENEIIPLAIKNGFVVTTDEGPRPDVTIESLGKLNPVFEKEGIVTAGNSSGINDGAAALVLCSERTVKKLHVNPLAEWIGGALVGVAPELMGLGPVFSTKKLLKKVNMDLSDIDIFEMNEAFAVQTIAVQRELGISDKKLNISGGAIALGHPVGASGARILVTLIYNMLRVNAHTGLAGLCIGGGMGCSTIISAC